MTRFTFSLIALFTCLACPRNVFAESPDLAPLIDALEHYQTGEGHWAYDLNVTEFDRKGRAKETRLERIDPSQPWDTRERLISIDGQTASEREIAKYQKDREKQRHKAERNGGNERIHLRDRLDLDRARVHETTADFIVFDVPLLPDNTGGLPPDKLEVLLTVAKGTHELARADVHLRSSVRKIGVAKISAIEMQATFVDDPADDHPAAIATLSASASASLLFVPVGGSVRVERTDLRWVKPYDERFDVQLGEATAIDF